jgi:FG-GAP repeat
MKPSSTLALAAVLLISTASVGLDQALKRANEATTRQQAELTASDAQPSDYFGSAVSLSGNRALIGGGLTNPIDEGAAYVYVFDGTNWIQEARLTPFGWQAIRFFW